MLDEDEFGLKEKTEVARCTKRPGALECGQRNLIRTSPLLGLQTRESAGASHLKAPSGGAHNRILNCGSPQTQGGGF